jgi:hypothetical protein
VAFGQLPSSLTHDFVVEVGMALANPAQVCMDGPDVDTKALGYVAVAHRVLGQAQKT